MPVTRTFIPDRSPDWAERCARCGGMACRWPENCRFAGSSQNVRHLRKAGSAPGSASDSMVRSLERAGGVGVVEGQEGHVRGMVFSAQPAVCAAPRGVLHDVSPGLPRGAPATPAAALRVPRAAYEVGLRVPD